VPGYCRISHVSSFLQLMLKKTLKTFTSHCSMSAKRVLVPIADGSEDIETTTITDVLVRAGVSPVTVSVMPSGSKTVTFARGLRVTADAVIADVTAEGFDAIVLPGGMPGAQHIGACGAVAALIAEMQGSGRLVGAICAAPAIALPHTAAQRHKAVTCYPALKDKVAPGVQWLEQRVVVDRAAGGAVLVTSQGPATAMDFALVLAALLVGEAKATEVALALLTTMPKAHSSNL
jgi:protein deglycase